MAPTLPMPQDAVMKSLVWNHFGGKVLMSIPPSRLLAQGNGTVSSGGTLGRTPASGPAVKEIVILFDEYDWATRAKELMGQLSPSIGEESDGKSRLVCFRASGRHTISSQLEMSCPTPKG